MTPDVYQGLLNEGLSFSHPLRPWSNAKTDAGFLDPEYKVQFGTWHRGVDLNGKGGGDTDLGWPVQSMFPGTVVEVDDQPGWGPVVLVRSESWVTEFVAEHLGLKLNILDVQYAHMTNVSVKAGDRVGSGDHLGGVGKGDGRYLAHLHLEMRRVNLPAIVRQGSTDNDRRLVAEQCLDPAKVIQTLPLASFGNAMRSGKQVAPTRLIDYNGTSLGGESATAVNRVGDKLYVRDGRNGSVVPTGFLPLMALAFQSLAKRN